MTDSLPPKPVPPSPPAPSEPAGWIGWFAIASAIFVGASLLITLSFLTFTTIGPVVGLVTLLFVVSGVHYLTWGWWLGPRLRERYPPEDDGL